MHRGYVADDERARPLRRRHRARPAVVRRRLRPAGARGDDRRRAGRRLQSRRPARGAGRRRAAGRRPTTPRSSPRRMQRVLTDARLAAGARGARRAPGAMFDWTASAAARCARPTRPSRRAPAAPPRARGARTHENRRRRARAGPAPDRASAATCSRSSHRGPAIPRPPTARSLVCAPTARSVAARASRSAAPHHAACSCGGLPARAGSRSRCRWRVGRGADVLFAPAYSAPLLDAASRPSLTVHDVSFWAHPEWFARREGLRRRWTCRLAAANAARVLTVSAFSQAEIVRWLGVAAARDRRDAAAASARA